MHQVFESHFEQLLAVQTPWTQNTQAKQQHPVKFTKQENLRLLRTQSTVIHNHNDGKNHLNTVLQCHLRLNLPPKLLITAKLYSIMFVTALYSKPISIFNSKNILNMTVYLCAQVIRAKFCPQNLQSCLLMLYAQRICFHQWECYCYCMITCSCL